MDLAAGAASPEIYEAARLEGIDLIVLCGHGETGLKRWVFGSIAQEAVRHSPVPVLTLNEHGAIPPMPDGAHPLRALVPLDGSALAESVILPTAYLVAALSASLQNELHLMRVVDLPSAYGAMKSQAHISDLVHEEAKQEVEKYVMSVAERTAMDLAAFDLQVSSSVVDSADVAGTIVREAAQARDAANSTGYDLIAMATHGRSGLLRLVMGSITEHVLGDTKLLLFIVRPTQAEVASEEKGGVEQVEVTEVEVRSWVGLLCYLFGWVGGLVFLLLERENRFVRFHALQSILFFGTLSILEWVFSLFPFVFWGLSGALGLVGFIGWIVLMVAAHRGRYYKLPVFGYYAEKLAGQMQL